MAQTMNFDEALDQILWWKRREGDSDTLVTLGLLVRVLFANCEKAGGLQWAQWAGDDWTWPNRFICPGCGNHWLIADRYEEWPVVR